MPSGDRGPKDIYAVGHNNAHGQISHYTGQTWQVVATHSYTLLHDVRGSAKGDVYIVGSKGIVQHHDGLKWNVMKAGTRAELFSVWTAGPGNVYASGAGGTILHRCPP